jgi:polyhydroxyalkanoate synthesis regulator phasin
MDLALTATYFPHSGLTFAILFGCPLSVEEDIVKRLSFATAEAAHPLLLPGIFSEIERSRHVHVVEATIDELETRIFELDIQSEREGMSGSESETRNQEKRSAWLDTTYLRNGLVSWNTQLIKISNHADQLNTTVFKPLRLEKVVTTTTKLYASDSSAKSTRDLSPKNVLLSNQSGFPGVSSDEWKRPEEDRLVEERATLLEDYARAGVSDMECEGSIETFKEHMRQVGHKIKHRIQAISDEYDEKIRDCTMRVDGMAMATQWV